MLGWLLSADFFFNINFFTKLFQEHYSECQTVWIHSVGPDLGTNGLQKSSADDKIDLLLGKHMVMITYLFIC